jgi:hypothetical protein
MVGLASESSEKFMIPMKHGGENIPGNFGTDDYQRSG